MTDKGQILNDAIQIINGERQDKYGKPEDSFALIAEYWQVYLRNMLLDKSENQRTEDVLFGDFLKSNDVAIMMALMKIAREHYQGKRDNVVDAAGYLGIYGDKYDVDENCFVEMTDAEEADPEIVDKDTITDCLGNHFGRWCPICDAEMEVVRPGKVQCSQSCDGQSSDDVMSEQENYHHQTKKCEICGNLRYDLHYFKGFITCERCIRLDCGVSNPYKEISPGVYEGDQKDVMSEKEEQEWDRKEREQQDTIKTESKTCGFCFGSGREFDQKLGDISYFTTCRNCQGKGYVN